jgi:hypothetical protein
MNMSQKQQYNYSDQDIEQMLGTMPAAKLSEKETFAMMQQFRDAEKSARTPQKTYSIFNIFHMKSLFTQYRWKYGAFVALMGIIVLPTFAFGASVGGQVLFTGDSLGEAFDDSRDFVERVVGIENDFEVEERDDALFHTTQCITFTPAAALDMIQLYNVTCELELPIAGTLEGEAIPGWFFEGTAPVKFLDEDKNVVWEFYVTTKETEGPDGTMAYTEGFVPFYLKYDFAAAGFESGYFVFEHQNAAGFDNPASAEFYVTFTDEVVEESPYIGEGDEDAFAQLFHEKYDIPVENIEVNITMYDEMHVKGNVMFYYDGYQEGGLFLGAADHGVWVLVYDGNGAIPCEALEPYNFSPNMVSECVTADGNIIYRDGNVPTKPVEQLDDNAEMLSCASYLPAGTVEMIRFDSMMCVGGEVILPISGTITGEAVGPWYFEAQAPVKLLDDAGNVLWDYYMTVQNGENWMTEDFVPFYLKYGFSAAGFESGVLVFEKQNAAGFENVDRVEIPVRFE